MHFEVRSGPGGSLIMSSSNSTVSADFLNETRAPQALAIVFTCPAIALILVVLRLYTRLFLLKRVFWEDYAIIAAMVTSIIMAVFMGLAFTNGSGRHAVAVTQDQLIFQSRISPGVHIPYIATHMFLKLSILLHYVRISVMAFEKRLCYAFVGLSLAGSLALLIVSFTRCIPFHAIWTPNLPGATCVSTMLSFYAVQIHTLVMDFLILLAPLFILRHLHISWQQRALLVMVVGFGGMACIFGVLRLRVLYLSSTSPDKTWDSFFSAIYGAIEQNLGIACACVVTLRPLFRQWRWWRTAGETEQSSSVLQVEPPEPEPRRRIVHHHDHILTSSTTVAPPTFVPHHHPTSGVELGSVVYNTCTDKVMGTEVRRRGDSCTSFATVSEDHSRAGLANAGP